MAQSTDECPYCKGPLETGYGFAGGGGIGVYFYCEKCELIIDKQPDPEMDREEEPK